MVIGLPSTIAVVTAFPQVLATTEVLPAGSWFSAGRNLNEVEDFLQFFIRYDCNKSSAHIYLERLTPNMGSAFPWGTPTTLQRKSLSARKLAKQISHVLNNPSMPEKANIIGNEMAQEDGVNNAVQLIKRIFIGGGRINN